MSTDNQPSEKRTNNSFFSWEFILVNLCLFALVALFLEQPVGSLEGKIALEQKGFGLYSYDIRKNNVYAVARGPRYGTSISRGVWVGKDGTFKINQLPCGEYSLEVRAPGFESIYQQSLFVEEGKVNNLHALKMEVLEPYVKLASNLRVFTTQEKPRFFVNTRGAVETTIRIYKKDFVPTATNPELQKAGIQVSTDLSMYTSYNEKFHNPFTRDKPVKHIKRTLALNYNDSTRTNIELDEKLAPGDYFVVADADSIDKAKTVSDMWWFTVTDIGLIVKQAPDRTFVRALDLNTLKAKPNVQVSVFPALASANNPALASKATTGEDGVAVIERAAGSANLMVMGAWQSHHAYGGVNYYMGRDDQYKTYFYTDRPVYRLGQTVSFKGLVRKVDRAGFLNPGAEMPVSVHVEDPTNATLADLELKTSKHGTFNGSVSVPEDGKTGNYQVRVNYADGTSFYNYFEVAQYRKPEYKIEIKPDKDRFTSGSKVRAVLTASYFFGAPVANAQVKYSIYSSQDWGARYNLMDRPEYYSFFDDWQGGSYETYNEYGGSFVGEGTISTDDKGQAVIEFDTPKVIPDSTRADYYWDYMDKRYKIEASVTDLSRQTSTGNSFVSVSAGDFALFVEPDSYVISPGESIGANVRAVGYDGKPVANQKLKLNVSRWPYNSITGKSSEIVLSSVNLVTDAEGKARASVKVMDQWPTDTFYLAASANDSVGNTIMDCSSVWVASSKYQYQLGSASEKQPFKISLDKKIYQPGDKAKVMISGPFTGKEGYDAIVTVEGTTLYSHKIIPLTASATMVEIPIEEKYTPNGYVGVTMVAKKKQIYTQTQMFMVSPHHHFLKIDVSTNKEKFKPGEKVTYTLKATRSDGKPAVGTELSLGVVDESIYSIRPEAAGDIQKYFFEKRNNNVTTLSTFPEEYSGGPDKMAASPMVRKNFKDTAAWFPQLITDQTGTAQATVQLPDNLTTWRATVRGISSATDVGATVNKILVTQDIVARLALPRFYTEGDASEVSAIIHNYSEANQKINLTLWLSDQFKSSVPLKQTLDIEKDKAARFSWPVTIVKSGQATVRITAAGKTAGDALERSLAVRSLGIPMFSLASGVLDDATTTADINTKVAADDLAPNMTISFARSTIGQVKGSFDSLIDYPYGCTEQTMSRLIPSIVAMELNKKLGVPLEQDSIKKFDKVRLMGIDKLTQHHHYDGGWGWWQADDSDPYMTCLVLEGLKMLKDSGQDKENTSGGEMVKQGLTWLEKTSKTMLPQVSDPKLVEDYMATTRRCDMARLAYTLSIYGKQPEKPVREWLKKSIVKLEPEPLAYTALALSKLGDKDGATAAYNRLVFLANTTGETVDWEHSPEMLKKLKIKDGDYSYRFTGVETTALALRAVIALEPDNHDRIEKIKNWLLLHRGSDGWSNTKTTTEVLLALMEEALGSKDNVGSTLQAKLSAGAAALLNLVLPASERWSKEKTVSVPFKTGMESLHIDKEGEGKLYYRSRLNFIKVMHPGEDPPVAAMPSGLTIERQFFRMETKAQTSDGTIHIKTVPLSKDAIKPGENILMKVVVNTPISLPYVLVESPLPSGAEVVGGEERMNAIDNGGLESEDTGIKGDWAAPWWSHQDVLDDRIVFFGTSVPKGRSEFNTMLRVELPGKVQLNPVTLEGMYTDKIRGYSRSNLLEVHD